MKIAVDIIIIAIFAIVLVIFVGRADKQYKGRLKYYRDYEMRQWRDTLDRQHTRIGIIEAENAALLHSIDSRDSTIQHLQALLKDYERNIRGGGSITAITTTTRVDTIVKTYVDTLTRTIYSNVDLSRWGHIAIATEGDSSRIALALKNKYAIIIGSERRGLFMRVPFAEVIDENPYTTTDAIRTYKVSGIRRARLSLGVQIGYGINNKLQAHPYIGVGLQYNLINIW